MYTDDTVIYAHNNTKSEVASILTNVLIHITDWVNHCCLQLNVSKTTSMYFTKKSRNTVEPHIFVLGQRLEITKEFRYFGIVLDSYLTFKTHVTKVCNRVKHNLANCRFMRDRMSNGAARMHINAMIISHITYC